MILISFSSSFGLTAKVIPNGAPFLLFPSGAAP